MSIWSLALIVFLFNIPFGYWRAGVRKFSWQWILAIHMPVPFVVALRIYSGIGFELITFPLMIAAFFGGQYAGARLHRWRRHRHAE